MENSFKENVRKQLLVAAQEYFALIDKIIYIESAYFVYQKRYIIKFNKVTYKVSALFSI